MLLNFGLKAKYLCNKDDKFKKIIRMMKSLVFIDDQYINVEVEKIGKKFSEFEDFNISNIFNKFLSTYFEFRGESLIKKRIYDGYTTI